MVGGYRVVGGLWGGLWRSGEGDKKLPVTKQSLFGQVVEGRGGGGKNKSCNQTWPVWGVVGGVSGGGVKIL